VVLLALMVLVPGCAQKRQASCAGADVQLVTNGRLTAGVDLSNAPFALTDPDTSKISGFEVELLGALAKNMGLRLTLLNRSVPSLLPAVLAHRIDVAAGSFRNTDALRAVSCPSAAYLDADLAVVVRTVNAQTFKSVADLAGRSVGVVRNGAAAHWASEHLGESSVAQYETKEDTLSDVKASAVDAAIVDRPVALYAQTQTNLLRAVLAIGIGDKYVLAGAPDGAFIAPLNAALTRLGTDGTLGALKRKWFGPGI
jgi:polar amino acid transport system substrate-binding protein